MFCVVCVPALCIQTHETNNASLWAFLCLLLPLRPCAPLASTRCKVETMTMNRVPCICTGLTLWPFLLSLTPPPRHPPWPLTSAAKAVWPVMLGQGRVCLWPFDRNLWEPAAFFLIILRRRVIPHCRTNKYQYNQSSNVTHSLLNPTNCNNCLRWC